MSTQFINAVRYLGPSFGGINLEDIKAPDCFIIEQRLREMMDIPVFHDDQHGTAIISAAGVINAAHLTGRKLEDMKVVVNGAGAAGIACLELIKSMGVRAENVHPVRHQGRDLSRPHRRHEPVEVGPCGGDQGAHAGRSAGGLRRVPRPFGQGRGDAGDGASHGQGADHLRHGQSRSGDHAGRSEGGARPTPSSPPGAATIPTRSTTCWAFPTSSAARWMCAPRTINEAMKIAAAEAMAALAREDVPDEVAAAYRGARPVYGPDYIIPVAVRSAPDQPGVRRGGGSGDEDRRGAAARSTIWTPISYQLSARLDPSAGLFQIVTAAVRAKPKRVVFAEGEEESVIRAAAAFQNSGLGKAILVGRADDVKRRHSQRAGWTSSCWKSACRIRRRKPRPISTRSTSASSGAACSTATRCAW